MSSSKSSTSAVLTSSGRPGEQPGAVDNPPWVWTRRILSKPGPRTGGSPSALLGAGGCGALLDALVPGGLAPGRVADLLRRVVRGGGGVLGRGRGAGHGGGRGWGEAGAPAQERAVGWGAPEARLLSQS